MNAWWVTKEWPCICNRGDQWLHTHYPEGKHACARCTECKEYRPDIPEHIAIRILLGPVMSDAEAATILLGPATLVERTTPQEDSAEFRCAICGWPLDPNGKFCVRGNCSQRPLPDRFYDPKRVKAEYSPYLDNDPRTIPVVAEDLPAAPRCETCTHWKPYQRDKGDCTLESDKMIVGCFGGEGSFTTSGDFGCVEWKAKS